MHVLGADVAYRGLLATLANHETRQTRIVWFQLTSFLHHAAMISKFVNPVSTKGIAIVRGKALQQALDVKEGSEVLPRRARDNVEHFDERIDRWLTNEESKSVMEIVVSKREGYDFLDIANKRVKRVLIADSLTFVSEAKDGTKFELPLKPIHEEIDRIGRAAESWLGGAPYGNIPPGYIRVG